MQTAPATYQSRFPGSLRFSILPMKESMPDVSFELISLGT